ncbi:MAG: hypothetical protein ACFFE8_09805 [Candidatus Heimdallarchaeota archaeon]
MAKTANPLINVILVFSVGLSALEIAQLVFDPANATSLTTFAFQPVLQSMFQGMFLSSDSLTSFWAVLVAWGISGAIAGVRAKNGFWGAFAGFLGTILGAGFLASANITALDASSALIEFAMGTAACTLVAGIAAFATGNATKVVEEPNIEKERTRKVWTRSKQEIWICKRCGNQIPPGAFSCPSCGEPVIE